MSAMPVTVLTQTFPELTGINNVALAEKWQDLKLQVVAVEITDATELEALEYTKALGLFKKDAEAVKKAALEPLKAQIVTIETPFKRLAAEIDKLDTMLRDGLRRVMLERKRREEERLRKEREEQLKALEAAAAEYEAKGKQEEADAVLTAAIVQESKPIVAKSSAHAITASSNITKVKKYRVDNADAVPREYCEPAAGKIWKAVQAGVKAIPGVSIWEEEEVRIR